MVKKWSEWIIDTSDWFNVQLTGSMVWPQWLTAHYRGKLPLNSDVIMICFSHKVIVCLKRTWKLVHKACEPLLCCFHSVFFLMWKLQSPFIVIAWALNSEFLHIRYTYRFRVTVTWVNYLVFYFWLNESFNEVLFFICLHPFSVHKLTRGQLMSVHTFTLKSQWNLFFVDLGATTTSTLYMSVCVWIWLIPTNALIEISHMYMPDLLISFCQSAEKRFLGASGCVCVYSGWVCIGSRLLLCDFGSWNWHDEAILI